MGMPDRSNRAADRSERQRRGGEWLRAAREDRGLSPAQFAAKLGIHPAMISNYELGKSAISDERAEGIAAALDMDLVSVRRGLGLWVPEGRAAATSGREQRVEQALAKLREALEEDGLLSKRDVDDLVRYGRFLATGQVTDRQRSVDE